jgi:hypothetical protein
MAAIIDGYVGMALERINRGHEMYLMTFMFNRLPGTAMTARTIMFREVERIYATLLTRIIRQPNRLALTDLPLWIVCPDYPVAKTNKATLADVTINDGQHMHALALIPPWTRLRRPFDVEVARNQDLLTAGRAQTLRIDAMHVLDDPASVADYGLKALRSRRVGFDDILLLPKVHAEVR